ncbi:hypothetical protein F511_21525 [Dorcoceras hygrometricum]|uniref:Uncharacterized protein n=1 Tax=Dorcoceras hygrometricum TaxID=472368 RepID=A0A2Z7C427_9LAMI|nr:hypothetical protein F511_21525 [Dorcoceras hygrometricum]
MVSERWFWWGTSLLRGARKSHCQSLKPYERASVSMLAGITRILERHSERSGKSHEEDVAERFRKQGPKEFVGTSDSLVVELDLSRTVRSSRTCLENFDG